MKSEFDTLEQYQESMKEFNENTRMGFEDFIQSHGSDRNKLQLRCTPYTSKKGGYGSFDLDFGLCVYQHQQSKVDEMQEKLDSSEKTRSTLYEENVDLRAKNDELQKRVDAAKYYMKNIFSGDAEVDQCHLGDLLDILDGKIVDEIEQAENIALKVITNSTKT